MKKLLWLSALVILAMGLSAQTLKDGRYFAEDETFASSGWKEQVILDVQGGKIVQADWNGVSNIAGARDKKSYDAAGKYGMVKFGKAQAEWSAQAKAVESYLIKTQDVQFSKYSDPEGHTDAISGASIHVKGFFDLVKKALASGPVSRGIYKKDGWFYAEQKDFDKETGWKETALITVVNGRIVDALWNGIAKDPAKKSKIVESTEGRYGLVKFGKAQAEWHEQAARTEAALVKAQDPLKIALTKEGKADAITGVSIHVGPFLQLAEEALRTAK